MSSQAYAALTSEWPTLPRFEPLIPRAALPNLAYFNLALAFVLTFYFSTLKRSTAKEVVVGGAAAVSASVGLCAAFCSLGCNV